MKRVFVSSTSRDLTEHRAAVRDAILSLGMHPVMMDHFAAMNSNAMKVCETEVKQCDYFVGIYAHRYGHIPQNETRSITEFEYDWAGNAKIPRLIFVIDEKYPWPNDTDHREQDSENYRKLESFKQRVGAEVTWQTFTTADSLAARVIQAITHAPPIRSFSIGTTEAILLTLLVIQWLTYLCATCGIFTGGVGPGYCCCFFMPTIGPVAFGGLFLGWSLKEKGKRIVTLSLANGISLFSPLAIGPILNIFI